jgi:hypothetical protein
MAFFAVRFLRIVCPSGAETIAEWSNKDTAGLPRELFPAGNLSIIVCSKRFFLPVSRSSSFALECA